MKRIIIAVAVVAAAAVSGYAIKASNEARRDAEHQAAVAECRTMISRWETQADLRDASPKLIDACILRGALTPAEVNARVEEIMTPPALRGWDWKKS